MRKKTPIKAFDIPVIILALAIIFFIAVKVYSGDSASFKIIVRGPDKSWIFPLNAEEQVSVPGPIGDTVVQISGGRAAIISSPCSGQTCVAAGGIYGSRQWSACLPNRVFLLIEGVDSGDGIDASSY